MDDGQDRVVRALVLGALFNLQRKTGRANWPTWFVHELEELALHAFTQGVLHVHRRTTVPAPPPPKGVWEDVTPARDLWSKK